MATEYVNPFSEKVIPFSKNRCTDSEDMSGLYSTESLKNASARLKRLNNAVKSLGYFIPPEGIVAWKHEDGKIELGDANTRLALIKKYKTNHECIKGIDDLWGVILYNDKINPKTNKPYTYDEFVEYTIYQNRHPSEDWKCCNINDTFSNLTDEEVQRMSVNGLDYSHARQISNIVNHYKQRTRLRQTVVTDILFFQGATKKSNGDKVFFDNEPWEGATRFFDTVDRMVVMYQNRPDSKSYKMAQRFKEAKPINSLCSLWKNWEKWGIIEDVIFLFTHKTHGIARTKLPFEMPIDQKQLSWKNAFEKFVTTCPKNAPAKVTSAVNKIRDTVYQHTYNKVA